MMFNVRPPLFSKLYLPSTYSIFQDKYVHSNVTVQYIYILICYFKTQISLDVDIDLSVM